MSRTIPSGLLDRVQIASPCPVRWDEMTGDDRVRRCALCSLVVHNLSAMTRKEAEAFLQQREELKARGQRVCLIFHRRADGTILTRDCPVGFAAMRRRARRAVVRVAALLMLLMGACYSLATLEWRGGRRVATRAEQLDPYARVRSLLDPPQPPPTGCLGRPGF